MRNGRGAFAVTATDATSSLTAARPGGGNSLTQALYVTQENASRVALPAVPSRRLAHGLGRSCRRTWAPRDCALTVPAGSVAPQCDRIHRQRTAGPGTA